jgi:SAM-dependent methyltransferase
VLEQGNRGPGAAPTSARKKRVGDCVAFLDSDDLWFPWTLRGSADAIAQHHEPHVLDGTLSPAARSRAKSSRPAIAYVRAQMELKVLRRAGARLVPQRLRPMMKGALRLVPSVFKYQEEIGFWEHLWSTGQFINNHYGPTFLAIAGEPDQSFLKDKIVADFGCGPQGSLCWASEAKARIGIDVLADSYTQFGITAHNMTYVVSSERRIPLPSNYVDVMFTINAMDHVNYFKTVCSEIVRVLAPGGLFVGSFNLGEPPTFSEPQTLSEQRVRDALFRRLDVQTYRTAPMGSREIGVYKYFLEPDMPRPAHYEEYCLWVRAKKKP